MICQDIFSVKGTVAGNRVSGVCVKANMVPAAGNVYGRCRNCVMDDTTVIHWTCTGRGIGGGVVCMALAGYEAGKQDVAGAGSSLSRR